MTRLARFLTNVPEPHPLPSTTTCKDAAHVSSCCAGAMLWEARGRERAMLPTFVRGSKLPSVVTSYAAARLQLDKGSGPRGTHGARTALKRAVQGARARVGRPAVRR